MERIDGSFDAFIGSSADDASYWNKTIRLLGNDTYGILVLFAEQCPCACPRNGPTSNHAPMSSKDLSDELLRM